MPVYTLVKESQVTKESNVYSDEAIALVEAAVSLSLQENVLKDVKDVVGIKLKDAADKAKSKVLDVADRGMKKEQIGNANRQVQKSSNKHVGEAKDALGEFKRLSKKIKWNGSEWVGGTPEERETYVQIANALNQRNKIQ